VTLQTPFQPLGSSLAPGPAVPGSTLAIGWVAVGEPLVELAKKSRSTFDAAGAQIRKVAPPAPSKATPSGESVAGVG